MTIRWAGLVSEEYEIASRPLGRVLVTPESVRGLLDFLYKAGSEDVELQAHRDHLGIQVVRVEDPEHLDTLWQADIVKLVIRSSSLRVELGSSDARVLGRPWLCGAVEHWAKENQTKRRTRSEQEHAKFHVHHAAAISIPCVIVGIIFAPSEILDNWPLLLVALAMPGLMYFTPNKKGKSVSVVSR
ncbi:hypothetical protein [Saccharopolyspora sp. NPDC002578]